MNFLKERKSEIFLLFYTAAPLILYFIPIKWLNEQHTICVFKNIIGKDCFGCGITRAIISCIQLDFEKSFYYNKIIIIVLPILFYEWLKNIIEGVKKIANNRKSKVA